MEGDHFETSLSVKCCFFLLLNHTVDRHRLIDIIIYLTEFCNFQKCTSSTTSAPMQSVSSWLSTGVNQSTSISLQLFLQLVSLLKTLSPPAGD